MFQAIQWDPSLGIDLGFFTIRYYSLMFLIAFGAGFYITKRIFIAEGVSLEKLDKLLIYTIFSTLVGARLGHVIFYQPELFLEDPLSVFLPVSFVPEIEFTGFRGLASHGAAIGIAIGMYFYSKKVTQKSIFWILDRITMPVAFGGAFVRIGNFLNSEIIGKATNSDFGVVFVQLGESFPRHPAQLYESVCYLILFAVLSLIFWKTKVKHQQGVLFGIFFTLLWTIRFFVEYVKEPQVAERADWLFNTGQLLSLPMIIIGFAIIYFSNKKAQPREAA
ncbi:prolipoprotein diacylglyceryl transferase [Psychroflexus tropicus]|uniref:prolipoprotein diacylglyceryl transferase n=1 Tax=Psychroflexus tropicus TaxID=197345 RepID=UPI000361ADB8|nr:prolipoprotein diacylglyceryl transferase [Psychroflexus tropicus]